MFQYQGDLVLMVMDKQKFIFTVVVFVDIDRRELQLVNRQSKEHEAIPMTQAALDNLQPCDGKEAKWKLVL